MTTKLIPVSAEERFRIWYIEPLDLLSKTEFGHGAILALMAIMPLYERVYEYLLSTKSVPDNRPLWVKNDLNLNSEDEAKLFWNVFRDGLCHTGSFYEESDKSKKNNWTLPKISLGVKHPNFPTFTKINNQDVITINPWGFISHVLAKYQGDLALLEYAPAPLLALHLLVEDTVN